MKQIIYFCIVFIAFSISCKSMRDCSSDSTITEERTISDTSVEESSEQTSQDLPWESYETPPSFPEGEPARLNFINNNLRYPTEDSLAGKQGVVYVGFIVSSDGSLSNFKILRSLTADCDAEALRIAKTMPKWIPKTNYGKPVKAEVAMPIRFKLPEQK